MKTFFQNLLGPAAFAAAVCWHGAAFAQSYSGLPFGGGGTDLHSVLTIHADGSSLFTTATIEPRAAAEQQARLIERYQKMSEAGDEAGPASAAPPETTSTNGVKPFTDEELVKEFTDQMSERSGDTDQKVSVAVDKDTVTVTTARSFSSLEEMLTASEAIWGEGGVRFENARLETDTNGLLRLTLTPQSGMERYLKMMRSQWKLGGFKTELRLVFPGRVVSSGLTGMETNATWLAVDAKQDDSLDAVDRLYAAPTVVTAELGGLKVDQPIEAKKLWRTRGGQSTGGDDLPVTDAGPGFVAEAQSITTTTLHVFPDGADYFGQNTVATGTVVNVKLFAPKGRTMKSVSDPRVLTAVDNQGRAVAPAESDSGESTFESGEFTGNGAADAASTQFQLTLQLPMPDAQAIDKLSAEAVALTVGAWKEMTLTNLQQNATNELDLSAVLPGAKMVIEKLSAKDHQFSLRAKLTGPPVIRSLELRAALPGNEQFESNASDLQSHVKDGQATRTLQLSGYAFGGDSDLSQQALVLKIRSPEDQRRERVKFDLKGLDLF